MIKLGLVGKQIAHSKSQAMYEKILARKIDYHLFDYPSADAIPSLKELFKIVDGVSITSPYKRHFLPQISKILEVPFSDAINCIKFEEGKFYATNTDYLAIKEISPLLLKKYEISQVFILGDGVMSKLTQAIFSTLNFARFEVLSRKTKSDFSAFDFSKKASPEHKILIINACSRDFVFSNSTNENCIFWDFNYGHEVHIKQLPNKVGFYLDGLEMLELQARYAVQFWNVF